MKFHAVHGGNIIIEDGGTRALRPVSFCDAITFSYKPISVNSRISILLGANEEWTGALRLGVTLHDPNTIVGLPRYACPDLTSKPGYWARPLPENWATNGTRLTFYVNSMGHFQLFVNNEHKGALLSGLPVKEQLWILLDLYGITVSVKFIATVGSTPVEVLARGPEALKAYQQACTDGSISLYRTRLAFIGPPGVGKTLLKQSLLSIYTNEDPKKEIDTTCICQTQNGVEESKWTVLTPGGQDLNQNVNNMETVQDYNPEEEYYRAIAANVVRELLLQRKKKSEEKKITPLVRSALRLQSSLTRKSLKEEGLSGIKQIINKDCIEGYMFENEDIPCDLPERVVELVESMLKEAESVQEWDQNESKKRSIQNPCITFNIWDYNGHPKYFILHQLFLSPQAIYILVFDLTKDLDEPLELNNSKWLELPDSNELTTIQIFHMWLSAIHISIGHNSGNNDNKDTEDKSSSPILLPVVIFVGTHRDLVHSDQEMRERMIEECFNKIKDHLRKYPYYHHVLPYFFAIENLSQDEQLLNLKKCIEEMASQQSHVGMEIPLKWLAFENALGRLIDRGIFLAEMHQLAEVARLEGIESDEAFHSMMNFYHHQGRIWSLPVDHFENEKDDAAKNIVVLNIQWFIDHIYLPLSEDKADNNNENNDEVKDNNKTLEVANGIISDYYFENLWPDTFHHKITLLDILETTDVICEIDPEKYLDKSDHQQNIRYFFPWMAQEIMDHKLIPVTMSSCLNLIVEFPELLPEVVFSKLVTRTFRWSEQHSWRKIPHIFRQTAKIAVDHHHDIILRRSSPAYDRIRIIVTKRRESESEDDMTGSSPSPHICAKVRHLLESELEAIRDNWYKRLSFRLCVPCPCERYCDKHHISHCMEESCVHLLLLNDCLSQKIIECDYRRVKTDFIQRYFPESSSSNDEYSLMTGAEVRSCWESNELSSHDPQWIRSAAKVLSFGNVGKDWTALSKKLGYSEREIARFEDDVHPSMSLIIDWMESNGRTRYCIDLLISCLEQIGRKDVADVIQTEIGPELPAPPVFISYQWDSQEAVLGLRRRMELAGFPCWMDVGQLGGGDSLYGKIYEGISKAKVVLCCLTPSYVISPTCSREASLSDVLHKPIVPVMLEPTPWPPQGPLAIILSSLVYVDLCGIGGHGGSGRLADWESRFQEIVERVSHYISPMFAPPILTPRTTGKVIVPCTQTLRLDEYSNPALNIIDRHGIYEDQQDETIFTDETEDIHPYTNNRRRADTPMAWQQPRVMNRVTRCSICVLL